MGKKDTVTKDYIRDMKVFADAFNYFIYGGEQVIKSDNQTAYLLLGVELQSNSHYAMPVEAIAKKHREDMKAQKKDECTDKNKNTKEKRQQPTQDEYLSGFWNGDTFVPNYRINFIAPASMSEEEIDKFRSSLREVMLYIKHSKDKEKLTSIVSTDERFKNLDRKAAEQAMQMLKIPEESFEKYLSMLNEQ